MLKTRDKCGEGRFWRRWLEWEYAEWFWLPPDTLDAYKFEVCPYLTFLKLWPLFMATDTVQAIWSNIWKYTAEKSQTICMGWWWWWYDLWLCPFSYPLIYVQAIYSNTRWRKVQKPVLKCTADDQALFWWPLVLAPFHIYWSLISSDPAPLAICSFYCTEQLGEHQAQFIFSSFGQCWFQHCQYSLHCLWCISGRCNSLTG